MEQEIKICATTSRRDLDVAIAAGANAVGFICQPLGCKTTRDTTSIDQAERLIRSTPGGVKSVLLPRSKKLEEIITMTEVIQPDRLQLGVSEDLSVVKGLHACLNYLPLIAQVIHVRDDTVPEQIDDFIDHVDFIHLDSAGSHPGGNGIAHDWSISREITERAHSNDTRVILAGGLNADNVAEAISVVRPDGVDVQTSIKASDASHDPQRVREFIQAANQAFRLEKAS